MFSAEFLLTSLVVVLVPGTGVIYTISNGLFLGWRASIAAAIGCTVGIVPHLTASVLGLSAIMHMSALAFQGIKYAGAAYLLYLAWVMWRESGRLSFEEQVKKYGYLQIAIRGVLINILNPKLTLFFLAFLPMFINPESSSLTGQMVGLSAVFMLMTLVVFVLYGISANAVRYYVIHSPTWIKRLQRVFAASFAALGVKLLMTDIREN